jgi:hypothetical protein
VLFAISRDAVFQPRGTLYQRAFQAFQRERDFFGKTGNRTRHQPLVRANVTSYGERGTLPTSQSYLDGIPLSYTRLGSRQTTLDSVVYQALFSNSIAEARSNILHGKVKVNGFVVTATPD